MKQEVGGRHAGLDLGRHHRQPRHLHVDPRARARPTWSTASPTPISTASPLIAITDSVFAPDLRDRAAPAPQPARDLRADREMEHDDRRQDGPPAGAPRDAHGERAAPPGPVHFELPQSETTREAGDYVAEPPLIANLVLPRPGSRRSQAGARHAAPSARRPIILVGLGVLWSKASAELVKFAEQLGAPVLTTTKCKGVIPEDHPLRAGCIIGGLIERELVEPGRPHHHRRARRGRAAAEALALRGRRCSRSPRSRASTRCVPAESRDRRRPQAAAGARSPSSRPRAATGARRRRRHSAQQVATRSTRRRPGSRRSAPSRSRARCCRATPSRRCDAGASRLLVVQKWQAYGPREFLTSNGLASMGYAIPGALGARLAHPDRPVVAFTGDGGFLMAIADLQTAVAREAADHRAGVRRPGDRR